MKFSNGVFFGMLVSFGGGGFHVQELQAVLSFMYTIYGSPVRGFGEDKMSWKPISYKDSFPYKESYPFWGLHLPNTLPRERRTCPRAQSRIESFGLKTMTCVRDPT